MKYLSMFYVCHCPQGALVRPNTVEITAQNYYLLNNMKWMQHVFMDSHVYSQKEIKSVRIPRKEFLEMLSLDLSVKDGWRTAYG